MDNIKITWQTIVLLAGVIVVFINAYNSIKQLFIPIKKVQQKVINHENLLQTNFKRLDEVEISNKVICKCLLALLDNEITGNSIDKLKSAKKDLQDFLIDK